MSSFSLSKIPTLQPLTEESAFGAVQERDEIIKIATRKSQDKTLTLEESNRLLEQFNKTLQEIAEQRKSKGSVDESWALDLLKDCDEDEVIVA